MIEDFENKEVRSSGELWSEICSSLPGATVDEEPSQDVNSSHFTDSFQPASHVGLHTNGLSKGTCTHSSGANWEPMEDSEIYIASLGRLCMDVDLSIPACFPRYPGCLSFLCLPVTFFFFLDQMCFRDRRDLGLCTFSQLQYLIMYHELCAPIAQENCPNSCVTDALTRKCSQILKRGCRHD